MLHFILISPFITKLVLEYDSSPPLFIEETARRDGMAAEEEQKWEGKMEHEGRETGDGGVGRTWWFVLFQFRFTFVPFEAEQSRRKATE